MICLLPGDPLHTRAKQVLSVSSPSCKSWFWQLRDICLLYSLPHPLSLLEAPLSKQKFKKLYKSKIMDYWETKLRQESSLLPSLKYFKPEYYSLQHPHPILWTAGSNPYEVAKSVIQCRMLSGRYPTEMLARHWSSNRQGWCLTPSCSGHQVEESLEHILLVCPSFDETRQHMLNLWLSNSWLSITKLLTSVLCSPPASLLQFILDASVHPQVISLVQLYGNEVLQLVFHLTRSWCFSIHKQRAKLLGSWL